MTKLTTERLEKFVNDIKTDGMCDITDYQVESALIRLLAYEQAAKNPIAFTEACEISNMNATGLYMRGFPDSKQGRNIPIYAAPVLPKQPNNLDELLSAVEEVLRISDRKHDAWDRAYAAIASIRNGVTTPAQPVMPDEITSASAPEVFEIAAEAERLGIRGTYASYAVGWNACRAEMLKAQQNEPQNIPENIPAQPVSNPYKLNSWISVADRLPSEFGRYLCYVEEQNDLGKSHYQWNCSWNGDVFSDSSLTGCVTHWMPLPAAPAQESEYKKFINDGGNRE